jgi:2-deoxy-D-gluconate 3-dehydrogenase
MQVNLNSVFTLSRDVGKHMLESRGGVSGEESKPEGAADANPRGRGKIINVASLLSYQGGVTVPAYTAAKHGVMGVTKALSSEWVSKGINVNAIAPGKLLPTITLAGHVSEPSVTLLAGYIATDNTAALIANPTRSRQILERIPANRWGSPEDFEGLTVFLSSAGSDYVTGECIVCDGGWMAR